MIVRSHKSIALTGVLLLSMLVLSCSRPSSYAQFVRTGSRDAYGRFVFNADMADTLSAYDFSLLASLSCIDREFSSFRSMPLLVVWESPDGELFEDNIVLQRSALRDSSYYDKVFTDRIGAGLVPVKPGLWKLYIKAPEDSLKKYGLTGIGLEIERVDRRVKVLVLK